ncbi:MAG: alpha/beta fold hydrolase [Nitrospirota bacterium]
MEHWTTISGLKIRYLMKGTGSPFVLLHGFSFLAETWVEMGLFDELAEKYTVYAFDMPYGAKSRSDKFDAKNRDEYSDFLKEMLQTLNIGRPVLLGASISGEITLRYLSQRYDAKAGILAGAVNVKNLVPRLEMIKVPVLGLWGERDNISPPDNAKTLADHVKDSEVHVIKGAGHACYLDKPEEFKSLVRKFLKKIDV